MPHQPTEPNSSGHPQVASHRVEETPEEILEYWTPERMAEANPRELILPPDESEEDN
ncbi:hypothetical protein ACW0JT_23130 [Arthrobacter sp. SA17]